MTNQEKTMIQREKVQAWSWAKTVLNHDFVILDLETTSFKGVPVQISVIDSEGQALYNSLIDPQDFEIDPGATAVHGITKEKVNGQPTFVEAHAVLAPILTDRLVVAYNVQFDRARWEFAEREFDCAPIRVLKWSCAMTAYAHFWGAYDDYHESYTWQKLGTACQQQGIDLPGSAHDALADCEMTLALIQAMAAWTPK